MSDIYMCEKPEDFIPGLELNKGFYFDVVKPLSDKHYPNLKYSASLIGHCSDVLGFDDYKSTDHVWGPRLQIFLKENDYNKLSEELNNFFKYNLPFEYKGFPTNYKPVEGWFSTANMQFTDTYPINHFIEIETVNSFFNRDISIDIHKELEIKDWLTYPPQHLLELTSGEVFHDSIGDLEKIRSDLNFYPDEVLLLRIYFLWNAISEERAFIGRCAEQGDIIGESNITNRVINKLIKLCFYYEKKYYPYSKWFGSSLKKLEIYKRISYFIEKALYPSSYKEREEALSEIYIEVIKKHNTHKLTEHIEPKVIEYHERGYKVFDADDLLEKIRKEIDFKNIRDVGLLSKVELFDDSYYGCSYTINKKIVDESLG